MLLRKVFLLAIFAAAPVGHAFSFTYHVGGGILDVTTKLKKHAASDAEIKDWIQSAADTVEHYYGKYPVKNVRIDVVPDGDAGHIGGVTYAGRFIRMTLGANVVKEQLARDWVIVHEMFHLGFPSMSDDFTWMQEGLSTYLEPLARARRGLLTKERVFKDMVEGFPQGLPEKGDRGLDHTHTWGRTYWGGALYWFLVDLEIREKTKNKKSLDEAIRAILNAGGDGSEDWAVADVITTGDQATGLHALKNFHESLGLKPGSVDLDALWKRLGVSLHDGAIIYDDKASLAFARKALMTE